MAHRQGIDPPVASPLIGLEDTGEYHVHSNLDGRTSKYSYPGSDSAFSSTVFLTLYEEEESSESKQPAWAKEYLSIEPMATMTAETIEVPNRPSVYYILRLFDSIRGFHKGYLDLSGRHPERYYALQSQWNRYLCSFLNLENIRAGDEDEGALYKEERWRRFRSKWRLPESICHSQLLKCTQSVLRDLKQYPIPQFQLIHLMDLPVDVLDNIISLASIAQAKSLSCTCHTLNDIGQRHIFRLWRMKLHVPPHVNPFNVEYSEIDVPALADYSRKDLEKNAHFILNTPHVSQRIQKLVLADEWWVNRRSHSIENNPFVLGMGFYKSITRIFGSVLGRATNLSTLVLCNLEVGLELVRRISEMPALHTLELHFCRVPRIIREKLSLNPSFTCSQIANLRLYMDSSFQETHSQWYSLLLCPRVRTLSAVQYGIGPFPSEDVAFWTKCRLDNLERLSLDNIDPNDLDEFTRWFTSNKTAGAFLTHFKLHMDWGVPDSEVLALLSALQAAPLEVLVLEGLAEAEFNIFDHIASQFPDLVALTLVRRQNKNQHQNKLALWPHASWEYAPYFRRFRALRHFCWNFLTEYWDATPTTLLAFESDFSFSVAAATAPASQEEEDRKMNLNGRVDYDLSDEVPYFLDSHWMALPFVAHCPTLESFSLMDRAVDMVCRVTRNTHTGKVYLTPKYCSHSCVSTWNVQQWNTVSSHWPMLSPFARLK